MVVHYPLNLTPRQGYFGGFTAPRSQQKGKGKRGHDGDDDNGGDDSDNGRAEGMEVVGGSEPRRRVSRTSPSSVALKIFAMCYEMFGERS